MPNIGIIPKVEMKYVSLTKLARVDKISLMDNMICAVDREIGHNIAIVSGAVIPFIIFFFGFVYSLFSYLSNYSNLILVLTIVLACFCIVVFILIYRIIKILLEKIELIRSLNYLKNLIILNQKEADLGLKKCLEVFEQTIDEMVHKYS